MRREIGKWSDGPNQNKWLLPSSGRSVYYSRLTSDHIGILLADIVAALLLSVVRTSGRPFAAVRELLTHAAKRCTVNTHTDIINTPHLIFSSFVSKSNTNWKWNCGHLALDSTAVMEQLLKRNYSKHQPKTNTIVFFVSFVRSIQTLHHAPYS